MLKYSIVYHQGAQYTSYALPQVFDSGVHGTISAPKFKGCCKIRAGQSVLSNG